MNRKEISVMADKEDECDEFLDRIQTKQNDGRKEEQYRFQQKAIRL